MSGSALLGVPGFQVAVASSEGTSTWSRGVTYSGGPVTDEDLSPIYCAAKLIVAGALLAAAHDHGISLDSPVRMFAEAPWVGPDTTLIDLLEHRAGLLEPNAMTWRMTPAADRFGLLPKRPQIAIDAYSDFLGPHTLRLIVEALTGRPIQEFVRDRILSPAGASAQVQFGTDIDRRRVRPAIAGLPSSWWPLMSEVLPDQIHACTPDVGGAASAAGLAAAVRYLCFGGSIGVRLRSAGEAVPIADAVADRSRRQRGFDATLNRVAPFGLGFMVDLIAHGVTGPTVGPSAFGHVAAIAPWVVVVDPEMEHVIAATANRACDDPGQIRTIQRSLLATPSSGEPALLTRPVRPKFRRTPTVAKIPVTSLLGRQLTGLLGAGTPCLGLDYVAAFVTPAHTTWLRVRNGLADAVWTDHGDPVQDVSLAGEEATLTAWLDDPDRRLGEWIHRGELHVDGSFWVLSPLKHWAATSVGGGVLHDRQP